jgi:pimeloyl-ACP methyl ester carboxylesterase
VTTDPTDLPPVVLLHGFAGSTARTWAPAGWLDLLADLGRTPIGIDLLGHGTAPKPHDPAAYQALEDHAASCLPADRCDAVGFSLGARVLLTLAARAPQRFRRIVVAGIGANVVDARGDAALAGLLGDPEDGGDGAASPVARYFRTQAASPDADLEALTALTRRPGHGPLTPDALAAITCPVLVVLGDADFAGPAGPLVDRLPDAGLVTLPGVDHFSTPKQFAFLDAALEFLGAPGDGWPEGVAR